MSADDVADRLLASQADTLGEQVLRGEGDPSFAACAPLLPELLAYTFLANEGSSEVIYVEPDGRLGVAAEGFGPVQLDQALFDPRKLLPPVEPTRAVRRLVGGYLPAVDFSFTDGRNGVAWQQLAFVAPTRPELYVAFKSVRVDTGEGVVRFRIAADGVTPIAAEWFDARLRELEGYWQGALDGTMRLAVPEAKVGKACLASLVRALITHDGARPHYGVGRYRDPKDDHFPPATLSTVNACTEWGLFARARSHLDYYLDHAVRPDGTFDYYGPAVSESGQMLDAIARYARRSRDAAWLRERAPVIESIADHLLALRHQGEKWPRDDPRRGLLFGAAEADARQETDYYYAGSVWTWRGWLELARAYADLGDEPMQARAAALRAQCKALWADIEASLQASALRTPAHTFVPPIAGFDKPFPAMSTDRLASYTNYRYWPEMLSAGCLRPEWHDAIIAYRLAHGGELLGTTRFFDRLDDWPYAGYAHALLARDRVRHFLLGFYGHLAAHCTRGTYTAYEQVPVRGTPTRSHAADYCVPAQLVTPLMAKWMLVFEEPDADVLWLARATPRHWLGPGQQVRAKRAPTRWGLVGLALDARSNGIIAAQVSLPERGLPAELRLRLRRPGARPLTSVTVNGQPHTDFDPQSETIRIVRPEAKALEILAR
ncbi:MAG TPA: hypothetical protein VNE39_14260 [Planctomycetota bacterium]|nr:hypothetical protein [Planctomycetota bacterium]